MAQNWIVEVSAVTDTDLLEEDDLDDLGNCRVDGAYRLILDGPLAETAEPEETALDVFHRCVPIACIDDFVIMARRERPEDAGEDWLREDLGSFSELPTPAAPDFDA